MSIVVIILVVMALLILGISGALRGVRASLLALLGTFLGVLLVDLWQEPWGAWVRDQFKPEQPDVATWMLSMAVFFAVVLITGLGSGVLLPQPAIRIRAGLRDRLAGGGIGLLNGALVASYLLHFASRGLPAEQFAALIESAPPLGILYAWLPWFVMAIVTATSAFILVRGAMRLARPGPRMPKGAAGRSYAAPSFGPPAGGAPPNRGPVGPGPGGESAGRPPSSPDRQEMMNRLNAKINRAFERHRQ